MNGNGVDFDSDTLKIALLTTSYTPDMDNHTFYSEVSTYELAAGDGYTTGGQALSTPAVAGVTALDLAKATYSNLTWTFASAKTFRYLILYKFTGVNSTSLLVGLIDVGSSARVGEYSVMPPTDGLVQFKSSPQTV